MTDNTNIPHKRPAIGPVVLMWLLPVVLAVPNIAFIFTESDSWLAKATDVALPMGIYFLLASWSRRIGRTTLLCIPLMAYAAFQIVLLYLYGGSIIAVDMFLNVATTNVSEATELLANLGTSITFVCVVYIPIIIYAIILVVRKKRTPKQFIALPRRVGTALTCVGVFLLVASYIAIDGYRVHRDIFPVNVINNMFSAVDRSIKTSHFAETSADFSYYAHSSRDSVIPEVYVMVIGETGRADDWQIFGYDRPTNPRLSQRDDILKFPRTLSESNTTHKSVPMVMSGLTAETFGDSIYYYKSVITAFKEAGYTTAFISNQKPNHSFIDFFGSEADYVDFIAGDGLPQLDGELLIRLQQVMDTVTAKKLFVVLHTYGSHFKYSERYPREVATFLPDDARDAAKSCRTELINAYDNTVVYTDMVLNSLIEILESRSVPAAMIYCSDHGEDIFDDSRSRFLHASPTPTYWQLHVPMLVWMSTSLRDMEPDLYDNGERNSRRRVSSTVSAFNTILQLAGVDTPKAHPEYSLVSATYTEPAPVYVTDYNEAVPLEESGLRSQDWGPLNKLLGSVH